VSPWGWSPARSLGIWRYGAGWMRPILAAVPYLTVGLLLLLLYFVGGTLTSSKGLLFDLPEGTFGDVEDVGLVLLVAPAPHSDMMVFFDETRYLLQDKVAMTRLGEDLAESVERSEKKTLLVLADCRVPAGKLLGLLAIAKRSGADRVLFAGKEPRGDE